MSDLEIGSLVPVTSSIRTTALARNMTSHDYYNAEENAELMVDAWQDEQLRAQNGKQSLGNNRDPVNGVHSLYSKKANNVLFSKSLSKNDIENRLSIPLASLRFIPIPEGEHSTTLAAIDSGGQQWNFQVSIRKDGSYPKPVLSGDWIPYVKEDGLKIGDRITFYVHKEEAGKDQYRFKVERKLFNPLAGLLSSSQVPSSALS